MKRKLVGILVCMLLISTFLTAAGKMDVKQMPKTASMTLDDDVPVWITEYSWTYAGGLSIDDDGIMLNIDFNEAYFGVVDDSGDSYTLAFGGDVEGEFSVADPSVSLVSDSISGNIYVTKSTLGFSQINIQMSGTMTLLGIPFPVQGTVDITITYDPDFAAVEFPLAVGNSWATPTIDVSIDVEITALGDLINQNFNFEVTAGGGSAVCVGQEIVVAGTETYTAYNISYGAMITYYAPSVGNFVKILPAEETIDFNLEMIATSYPSSDNPLKPETPSGPSIGNIGVTHSFTTKAIDPNGDQIKYCWDWDGDLVPDEWTGFYDSDIEITTSHVWTEQGDYEIRVKARDGSGLEGIWSDPLPITLPRNRAINTPFLNFLQNFLQQYPILYQILQRLLQL